MKEKLKNGTLLANLRTAYLAAFLVVRFLDDFVPLQLVGLAQNTVLHLALAGVGAVLLLLEFIFRRDVILQKPFWLKAAFLVIYVVSAFVNRKYGVSDNVRTFIWMVLYIFAFACADADLPRERRLKDFHILTAVFTALWSISVLVSIGQFLMKVGYVEKRLSRVYPQGFIASRLFGVFPDPNYAAMSSVACVFFMIAGFFTGKKHWGLHILRVLAILVHFSYIVLSGSRTGQLCLMGGLAVTGLFGLYKGLATKLKPVILRVLLGVLAAGILAGGVYGLVEPVQKVYKGLPNRTVKLYEKYIGKVDKKTKKKKVSFNRESVEQNEDISNGRLTLWKEYCEVLLERPVFGTSARNHYKVAQELIPESEVAQNEMLVHNLYLSLFVCLGIPGGLVCMAWLVILAIRVIKTVCTKSFKDEDYGIILCMAGLMFAMAMSGMSLQIIFFNDSSCSPVFWMASGFLFQLAGPEVKRLKSRHSK